MTEKGISSTTLDEMMGGKIDYYKDTKFASFSGLKVFSKCETLYRDMFVSKTYEEPERDYFVYGKLVDAMISESEDFIKKNFVLVERKIKPEDALAIENKVKALHEYLDAPEFKEKLAKGNKTAQKGYDSRMKQIQEFNDQLILIAEYGTKQQVTPSVWENAEQTALAIKTHPIFSTMVFDGITSQQTFATVIEGIPCKGKLDHLKLSPEMSKIYGVWKAGQISASEMRAKIAALHDTDKWAIITDLKTCYDIAKLEPFNKHYRGQLKFYQRLVAHVLGIPEASIECRIYAADKVNNNFKKCEVFTYQQDVLDERIPDINMILSTWYQSMLNQSFVSEKEKYGIKQECFTCTECRLSPFAKKLGQPVLITGPRFESSDVEVFSTVDAVLEY